MSTSSTVRAWSTTDASNASADANIASSDSQSPDSLDNNIRSIMAAVKKQMNDIGGSLSAGGSANALTVTTGQVLESGQITDGLRILLKATADNTSTTVTFAPDGLTARNIKRADGSALTVGSIRSGMYLDLIYNSGSSEWRAANIAPVAGLGGRAAFSAYKSSSQAISTTSATKVAWGTEVFDVGSYFASDKWTPPAGIVTITAVLDLASLAAGSGNSLLLYKNGAYFRGTGITNDSSVSAFGGLLMELTIVDQCNGTDYYEIYAQSTDSAYSVLDASAGSILSYFCGAVL